MPGTKSSKLQGGKRSGSCNFDMIAYHGICASYRKRKNNRPTSITAFRIGIFLISSNQLQIISNRSYRSIISSSLSPWMVPAVLKARWQEIIILLPISRLFCLYFCLLHYLIRKDSSRDADLHLMRSKSLSGLRGVRLWRIIHTWSPSNSLWAGDHQLSTSRQLQDISCFRNLLPSLLHLLVIDQG